MKISTYFKLMPGFSVCLCIAILAQVINLYIPLAGSALFAIAIGVLCGNTVLNRSAYDAGTKFSESRLLEYSIVLTGLTLRLSDIAGIGLNGILYTAAQMAVTITGCYLIGKQLGFGKKFCLLMSAGNAVCGSSAIAAVSPILRTDAKNKGISITIVNVTGTVLMVLLPVITGILYHQETMQTSGMIGGILQSIGQVIASATFVNKDVVEMATIFKIIRIVCLTAVAYLFSRMDLRDGTRLFHKELKNNTENTSLRPGIPWFIIGFFLLSVIHSFGIVPDMISHAAKLISSQFEIIALAAIGMRVKFKDLMKEGPKALLYGGCVGFMQILTAIVLIKLFIRA